MCGIAGIWFDSLSELERRSMRDMVKKLHHRGPDDSGVVENGKMLLGHTRLSIVDLRPEARQPMCNEDKSLWLVFNGEIYNFRELRNRLEQKGHQFRSNTDSEVLIHLYEDWGEAMVDEIDGMFAFAIWDSKQQRCLLARDRFGEKPLFYSHEAGHFCFSSEIGRLSDLPWIQRSMDPSALSLFWQLHYIPSPWTIYSQVRRLPAGHIAIFENDSLKIRRYYPRPAGAFSGSIDEATERFMELFQKSVRRCLVADVPVGLALSAGLDSSAIAAVASSVQPLQAMTVDFAFSASAVSEANIAEETAKHFGLPHIRLTAEIKIVEEIQRLVGEIGEPFLDAAMFPSSAVYRSLAGMVTVVLGGDGGDEMLGGYSKYLEWWKVRLAGRVGKRCGPFFERALRPFYSRAGSFRNSLKPWLCALRGVSSLAFQSRLGRLVLTETRPDLERLFHKDVSWWKDVSPLFELELQLSRQTSNDSTARTAMDKEMLDILPEKMLRKVDVCSMAHSVEARSPLMDHHLIDFCRTLPDSYLWRNHQSKRMLRRGLAKELPHPLLDRPKTGFSYPLREAVDREMPRIRERLLDAGPLREWCRLPALEGILGEHTRGSPWHTTLILKLLILEAWKQNSDAP